MPAIYEKSERIKQVAEPLLSMHHQEVAHAKIAYMMKMAPEESDGPKMPTRMGKHPAMTKARSLNALMTAVTGLDFIIEVDEVYWDVLTLDQQIALIDHELCHLAIDEKGFYLKDHDIEEFCAVIQRHGCWMSNVRAFADVVQMNFMFDGKDPNVEKINGMTAVQ
jgi:hypothetical protein